MEYKIKYKKDIEYIDRLRSCLLKNLVQSRLLISWFGNRARIAHVITVKEIY